jgi:hypothetical protein
VVEFERSFDKETVSSMSFTRHMHLTYDVDVFLFVVTCYSMLRSVCS